MTLELDQNLADRLEAEAARDERPKSQIVRRALVEYLSAREEMWAAVDDPKARIWGDPVTLAERRAVARHPAGDGVDLR